MCSGAIVNSRIKKVVIGARHIKNSYINKQNDFKKDYLEHNKIELICDVMQEDCSQILQKFFKDLRKK